MSDPLETRDAIEADMARHERDINGTEVHAARNQSLAAEALRELDKAKATSVQAKPVEQPECFTQKREINGHTYTLDKAPDKTPMYRPATEFEREVMQRALPRIQLLLSKPESGPLGSPSWRHRALAAFYFKTKSHEAAHSGKHDLAEVFERAYQLDLSELLEASNQPFGDWRTLPEQKQA